MTAICQIYPHRKGLDRGAVRPCVGLLPHPSTSSPSQNHPLQRHQNTLLKVNHVRNLQNASCRRTQAVAERSSIRELSDLA